MGQTRPDQELDLTCSGYRHFLNKHRTETIGPTGIYPRRAAAKHSQVASHHCMLSTQSAQSLKGVTVGTGIPAPLSLTDWVPSWDNPCCQTSPHPQPVTCPQPAMPLQHPKQAHPDSAHSPCGFLGPPWPRRSLSPNRFLGSLVLLAALSTLEDARLSPFPIPDLPASPPTFSPAAPS